METVYLEKGKPEITELILRKLPRWFGIEEATQNYIQMSKNLPMIIAYKDSLPIGFISLKNTSQYTSEIYVMGVDPQFHRTSCGTKLIQKAEKHLIAQKKEFLQVKTLSEKQECEFYAKTRLFYKSQGFKELEVFPNLWDKENPCLLMIKHLKSLDN